MKPLFSSLLGGAISMCFAACAQNHSATTNPSFECAGPTEQFALFDAPFSRMAIDRTSVYLWSLPLSATWKIDKRTRAATSFDATIDLVEGSYDAAVVSDTELPEYETDRWLYRREGGWLCRHMRGETSAECLFAIDDDGDQSHTFVIVGADYYATSSSGVLWHARLEPDSAPPEVLDRRGEYDDDDYGPLLGADDDAVYWQAGADPAHRASDGAPLALFRTCR